MNMEELSRQCLDYPEVEVTTPFGPEVLVYKVVGKMFALTNPDEFPQRVNLKCDPDQALEYRDQYEAVMPGYHMNKKHWNTVLLEADVPSSLLISMIDQSYRLVVRSLKKADRDRVLQHLDE